MASTQKVGVEGLEIHHVFADSIAFKKKIYCSFLRIGGGEHKYGHFLWKSYMYDPQASVAW